MRRSKKKKKSSIRSLYSTVATPERSEGPELLWDSEADRRLNRTRAALTGSGSSGLAPSAEEMSRMLRAN